MNKKIMIGLTMGIFLLLTIVSSASAQDTAEGQYAPVNGVEMYYEVYGEGDPLILLHGGLGGIVEYAQLIPLLAETRQVIAVELQGHGHTADIDRPLRYETLADDVAALIAYLGFANADVMGYSLGGGVALRTAIQHPDSVRKLVLVSTPFQRGGIHPEFNAGMEAMSAEAAPMMLETPMYQFYSSVAPRVEDWATLVGKVGDMLRPDYDWTEDIASVSAPTLIVVGDNDFIPPTHAAALYELLGGGVPGGMVEMPASQMAVLPNTFHFTILGRTDLLLPVLTPFLDTPAS